jgi:hypothetical protein
MQNSRLTSSETIIQPFFGYALPKIFGGEVSKSEDSSGLEIWYMLRNAVFFVNRVNFPPKYQLIR